jgi:hypothetical protein
MPFLPTKSSTCIISFALSLMVDNAFDKGNIKYVLTIPDKGKTIDYCLLLKTNLFQRNMFGTRGIVEVL